VTPLRTQSGQAMTEFIVAMLVLLPLFLAVTYAGRFGDIQMRATQASRYAAFERAMQPDAGKLSDDHLADQMRARFFARGDALHGGAIQSDDSVTALNDSSTDAMWRDIKGDKLLGDPKKDVTLVFKDVALDTSAIKIGMDFVEKSAGKSWTPGKVAQVDVKLANKLDLGPSAEKFFTIGAATAAAGNGLGSSGSKATRDAAAIIVPTTYIPGIVDSVLDFAIDLFEDNSPQFGCIKPDVVPADRLNGVQPWADCK
jgi:hypothetical protein